MIITSSLFCNFSFFQKTATKIVEEFKENTLEIILNTPEQLEKIPRLPQRRIEKIHNVLKDY
ncbi:MAG: hypothetical protein J6S87_04025, partial [Bacteroidales bacterium]|nr:hypothetical protein [Bacteroidales bacterium]